MSLQAISWALDESRASGNDRLVMIVMCHYTYDDGFSGLSKITLANETLLSDATIVRSQASLVALGEIERATKETAPGWWLAIPSNRRPTLFMMKGFLGSHYATPKRGHARGSRGVAVGSSEVALGSLWGNSEVTETPSDQGVRDVNREERKEIEKRDRELAILGDFELWWKAYPRKLEKRAAQKAYATRRKEGSSSDVLLTSAQHYAEATLHVEKTFVKYPATFLNQSWSEWLDGTPEGFIPTRSSKPLQSQPLPVHRSQPGSMTLAEFEGED